LARVKTEPVYTNYVIQVERRAELVEYLAKKGIRVVIQYPIPIHLQQAARYLGYKKGSFPVCEKQADRILTIPVHQYLGNKDIRYVVQSIRDFYAK
jgi:dTDP-4-amino-4,6-dideoxygalactose transaminase